MRLIKLIVSLSITIFLIYALNNRFVIQGSPVPPLGKFLDPFHGFWQNAESDSLPYAERIDINGLQDAVQVYYDDHGIPHIFAQNDHDLYMAQGYVVAQHRLWQMDFQTYAAAGRISELIGEVGLNFDRLQRRKGMVYGAEKSAKAMESNSSLKAHVEAYTQGVNEYISSLSYKDLPLEYKLLNYSPEPWSLLKSALLLQYMTDNLTGWDRDVQNTQAYWKLGEETFYKLFPQWPAGIDPVAQSPAQWPFEAFKKERPDSIAIAQTMIKKVHPMPDPDNGSNNWAVAAWKTKNGASILANDMHLGLNAPSLWFMVQLHSPTTNVMGFALAGNIGVVAGFNENIAWGFTDVSRDERDWYAISFTDATQSAYVYDGQEREIQKHYETIKIRDGHPYMDTVLYTHYGPIVYDHNFLSENGRDYLALKWIGHHPSRVQEALLGLNRATRYDDYVEALTKWDAPSQHVAFASTRGEVAIRVQGLFPLRFKDQGLYVMDGTDPAFEWGDFVPTTHYPYQYNPGRGFISSANQHSVDGDYPYNMGWLNMEHYRNRRINNVLNAYDSGSVTPSDMMALQNDAYGIRPAEALPIFIDSLGTGKHANVIKSLQEWDYIYSVGSKAPTYFEAWWRQFEDLLWDELKSDSLSLSYPSDYQTIALLKNGFPAEFYDHQGTPGKETLQDILAMSLDSAVAVIKAWEQEKAMEATWGNYKNTSVVHLARIPALGVYNIQVDGQSKTVNSTKPNHGPSQRIVVEMTSPPQAWAILPGGQSGNPGNPLYNNMISLWRDGEYLKLNFMLDADPQQDHPLVQTFNPGK